MACLGVGSISFNYYLSIEKPHHFAGRKFKVRDWMKRYFTQEDQTFLNTDLSKLSEIAELLRQIPAVRKPEALLYFLKFKYTDFDLDQPFQKQYENNNKKLIASLEAMIQ